MMRFVVAGITGALLSLSPQAARAEVTDPNVLACLAAFPGSVPVEAGTTDGDDTICIGAGEVRDASLGNDTYLWTVEPTVDEDGNPFLARLGSTTATGDQVGVGSGNFEPDPGTDTLSLASWSQGWNEETFQSLGGTHVIGDVFEEYDYTMLDDTLGHYTEGCAPVSANVTFDTLGGADVVNCVAGTVITGDGGDIVTGVSAGTTVSTGAGTDTVIGDLSTDLIDLGADNDLAIVDNDDGSTAFGGALMAGTAVVGIADVVDGGEGTDTVYASQNDFLSNVENVHKSETTTPVAKPAVPTKVKAKRIAPRRTVVTHARAARADFYVTRCAYNGWVKQVRSTSLRVVVRGTKHAYFCRVKAVNETGSSAYSRRVFVPRYHR